MEFHLIWEIDFFRTLFFCEIKLILDSDLIEYHWFLLKKGEKSVFKGVDEVFFGVRCVSDKCSPMSTWGRKQFSDHKAVGAAKSQTPTLAWLIEVPH